MASMFLFHLEIYDTTSCMFFHFILFFKLGVVLSFVLQDGKTKFEQELYNNFAINNSRSYFITFAGDVSFFFACHIIDNQHECESSRGTSCKTAFGFSEGMIRRSYGVLLSLVLSDGTQLCQ